MEKKKVVVYGNCHTEAIISMLLQVPEFCEKYDIIPILPIQNIKDPKYLEGDPFRECDLFIHQSIRKDNRYGEQYSSAKIIEKLKEGCEVISIPNVYHLPLCFFPNYSSKKEFVSTTGKTCFFRDVVIDKSSQEGKSSAEIYNEYNELELFDSNEIKQQFDLFMHKVKAREEQWDIKVSQFIYDNYSEHKLFHDPNHPTNYFFAYIVNELLGILGIEYNFELLVNSKVRELDSFEMPICKSVKHIFGMKFEDGEMRITGIKTRRTTMFLDEYIDQYRSLEWQNTDLSRLRRVHSFIKWIVYRIEDKLVLRNE